MTGQYVQHMMRGINLGIIVLLFTRAAIVDDDDDDDLDVGLMLLFEDSLSSRTNAEFLKTSLVSILTV